MEHNRVDSLSSSSSSPLSASTSSTPLILTAGATIRVNAFLSFRSFRAVLDFLTALLLFFLVPFRLRSRSATPERAKEVGNGAPSVVRVPAALVPRRRFIVQVDAEDVACRREIASREVREDHGVESVRECDLFTTRRGDSLFTQSWTSSTVKTRALVIVLHGLNEHSGRYNSFAKELNRNGYKAYGIDWTGHGGSDALHGYVPSLDNVVADLKSFLVKVMKENPVLPCFLFGHSTGSSIILKATLDPKVESVIKGIVLTAPAIRVQPSNPIFGVIAPLFSLLLPRYQIGVANEGPPVSRDPDALIAKYSDPLVYTGFIRVRTGYELIRITSFLQQNLKKVTVPFFVMHGCDDKLTDPDASKALYAEASSIDKSIKLYEGLLHDLLTEPEKDLLMKDIIDWLNSKL